MTKFPPRPSPPPTLDELAAMAMQGLIASGALRDDYADEVASDAYKLADAMLAERRRRNQAPLANISDEGSR